MIKEKQFMLLRNRTSLEMRWSFTSDCKTDR